MFGQSTDFLIGELLLKAGIIKQNQLDEALKLAGNKHMQIGQMLIMARSITQKDLQAAIDAQVALRDKIVDMNGALKALSAAHRSHMTFAEASQKHQNEDTSLVPSHKLGQILLEANLINGEQLSVAVQKSMATGLPVGRILILNSVISETTLAAALEVLIKLRDGNVVREEAVSYLSDIIRTKAVDELGVRMLEEASVFNAQPVLSTRKSMRLGEFLVLAGILSETDIMNALEFSLVAEKQLGEALLEHGYITRDIIEAAIKLQSLVESDTLDATKAGQCLNLVHFNSISLTDALEKVSSSAPDGSKLLFGTLLIDAQLLTEQDIQSALDLAASNPRILAQILTQTGYLSSAQADVLIECHENITQNAITHHDAKYVLDFCLEKLADGKITFAQGLQELGWSKTEEAAPAPTATPTPAGTPSEPSVPKSGNPNKISMENKPSPGSFITDTLPEVANQSSINKSSVSDVPRNIKSAKVREHSGRTTSNMPAIGNLQAGSNLNPLMSEKALEAHSSQSDSDSSQKNTIPSGSAQSIKVTQNARSRNQPVSLKSLLQEDDSMQAQSDSVNSSDNECISGESATNGSESNKANDEELELSESEKALIMKASSLTASPQEIMAAMKLAAKKDKTIQSQDKSKE